MHVRVHVCVCACVHVCVGVCTACSCVFVVTDSIDSISNVIFFLVWRTQYTLSVIIIKNLLLSSACFYFF